MGSMHRVASVDLYWLPVGAGSRLAQWASARREAARACRDGRPAQRLFHAAVEVRLDDERYVIEMAPAGSASEAERGVVFEGPAVVRALGRFRCLRYEVRCWRDGRIANARAAVGGPVRLSTDVLQAGDVLDVVRWAPWLTWGRDENRAGERWTSNALVAWVLATSGHDLSGIRPPDGGRAPGWAAGISLAAGQRRPGDADRVMQTG